MVKNPAEQGKPQHSEHEPPAALADELQELSDHELSQLIQLPPRVFQELVQEFGRDELIALLVSMAATSAAGLFDAGDILLAVSGPIVEKIGLFLYPSIQQYLQQKNLPPEQRASMLKNIAAIWQENRDTLARDLLLHDPIYTITLLLEMQALPNMPVAVLSAIAFTIAILLAVGTEIGGREVLHKGQLHMLKRQGFEHQPLYEARVVLQLPPHDTAALLNEVQEQFGFGPLTQAQYHDHYYEQRPAQNGRKRKVRHRVRTEQQADGSTAEFASVQVVYEKLTKDARGFFPTSKDKLRLPASSPQYAPYVKRLATQEPTKELYCHREYMRSAEGVYVSCDRFSEQAVRVGGTASGVGKDQDRNQAAPTYVTLEVKSSRRDAAAVRQQQEILLWITSRYPEQIIVTNKAKSQWGEGGVR